MELQLEGKHALVTASTAGISIAIAKGLAKEGSFVIVSEAIPRERADRFSPRRHT